MAFPGRLLHDGEDVVLDLRPHWSFFAAPAAALAGALAVLVGLASARAPEPLQLVIAAATLVALARFVVRYVRWATTNFVVTTHRLVHRRGVLAKEAMEIPLERVNAASCRQSVVERMVGNGRLIVEAGGEHGRQSFSDIPRPAAVQREIYRQAENKQAATAGVLSAGGLSVVEQLERLDVLCRRGVVTRAEFEANKARLLDRM